MDYAVAALLVSLGVAILVKEFKRFNPSPGRNARLRQLLGKKELDIRAAFYDRNGKPYEVK